MRPMKPLASLTIWHLPPGRLTGALVRMASGPPTPRGQPGLRFARLLGTARGRTFGPWDRQTWALFALWDSEASLAPGLASPALQAWDAAADEVWTLRAEPLSSHGQWGGSDPLADLGAAAPDDSAPVLILTRASIRLQHLRTFRRAAEQVEQQLAGQEGLIASLGAGETPLLDQATFSLWSSGAAAMRFAYGGGAHPDVVKRTRAERWYREELFARFRPLSATGTWNGREPLALARTAGPTEPVLQVPPST
jgi:hypothetical protein